jgi:hypothetical protein
VGLITEEEIEIYFTKGEHLGVPFSESGIVSLGVLPVSGERFGSCFTVLVEDFGGSSFELKLTWSPSRAGDERIPWNRMITNSPDGKTIYGKEIDAREHPLFGTKNEQEGLYHPTLPAGCYILREVREI